MGWLHDTARLTHDASTACTAPLQLVKDYQASGRLDKEVDFSVDDKILAAVNA